VAGFALKSNALNIQEVFQSQYLVVEFKNQDPNEIASKPEKASSRIKIQDPTKQIYLFGGFFWWLAQKPASIFKSEKGLKAARTPRTKPTTIPKISASNTTTVT